MSRRPAASKRLRSHMQTVAVAEVSPGWEATKCQLLRRRQHVNNHQSPMHGQD